MAYTTIKKPSDYFNTLLHTGDGTDGRGITGVGFQPDLTWFKARNTAYESQVYDIIRGATKKITTTDSGAEATQANGLQSFDSDGFTVGNANATNVNSVTYASWNWLGANGTSANTDGSISSTVSANTTSGFSIVSYTGNGTSDSSIGHGLGATPKITITKNLTTTSSWRFTYYFVDGSRDRLLLDTSTNKFDSTSVTADDSSVFYVDNGGEQNTSGNNYIAYCFAEKKGFSKFGSYTGNGSADGTFVYTGFKPAWVMTKRTDASSSWDMHDTKRDIYNVASKHLLAEDTGAEGNTAILDILSNGFKFRSSNADRNASGGTYIYMAFAEEPLVGDNPATAR